MDDTIREKLNELVEAIQKSSEFDNFQAAERQVRSISGLPDKIREFCWKNYKIQNSEAEDLCEQMEKFEAEYEEFRKNPVVEQYLEHELRMCRMLQEINGKVMDIVELVI